VIDCRLGIFVEKQSLVAGTLSAMSDDESKRMDRGREGKTIKPSKMEEKRSWEGLMDYGRVERRE
jgi:hypothetical protein